MLRLIARLFGYWLMAGAVVLAVVDGAKSIAGSALVTTSVGEVFALASGRPAGSPAEAPAAPWPLDVAIAWLMSTPCVAVLAILGIAFLVLGAKKRRPMLSREFAA